MGREGEEGREGDGEVMAGMKQISIAAVVFWELVTKVFQVTGGSTGNPHLLICSYMFKFLISPVQLLP